MPYKCPVANCCCSGALSHAGRRLRSVASVTGQQASQFGATALDQASRLGVQAAQFGSTAFDQARERVTPVLTQAGQWAAPLADDALERARAAKAKAAGWAAEHLEQVQPTIAAALEKVPPAVDRAQRTIQDEFLPGLVEALHEAAGTPTAVVVVPKSRSVFKTILKVAAAGAILAAIGLALKAWLASSRESAWSSHEPRQAYVYPDDADTNYESDLTTDSYIGANPPEGFTIKGNARSKKYHVPGSRGYDRTIAEVWFQSESAAEAAGFTKAQG